MKKRNEEVKAFEQTEDELLNTMYIKEIIEEFYENQDEEHSLNLFGHITLRLMEDGKAPMALMNANYITLALDPDIEAEEVFEDGPDPEEMFVTVTGENGRPWFPLYTDRNEMGQIAKTNAVKEVPIIDIFRKALEAPGFNGVLVNPHTDGFRLSKEALELIVNKVDELKKSGFTMGVEPDGN